MKNYFLQILIAFDQFVNTLFGGWADETISARAYRQSDTKTRWKIAMKIIDTIFFWQKNHCYNSYIEEKERLQVSPEYR